MSTWWSSIAWKILRKTIELALQRTIEMSNFSVELTPVTVTISGIPIFPQQRKLMGSSAQNSSFVHRCRCRVRFNEVPEKVPKVPERV